jgi:Na+/melibiose symporter-like transporter
MIVAVTVVIGQWFVGKQLGFAFGVNLSIARAGSYSADMSPTFFSSAYEMGWQPPLYIAVAFAAVAVAGCVAYYFLSRSAEQRFQLAAQQTDRFVWRDLWTFDRSYWYIVGLCVLFYSVIFPFRSTFAIKYFQHAHGLSLQEAGSMNAYVFLAAIFATPAFGFLADRFGRRAAFMAFGSLLLATVFPVLAYTNLNLWFSTALIGIAFSLVPAVLWPAVPYLVSAERLGTAYGLMTMLQNIGMLLANLGAGALNDASAASPENPAGYDPMLLMFFGLSLFGFAFAFALRRREAGSAGHGLESIKATVTA